MKTKSASSKHWWDMTESEREIALKEFDKPIPKNRFKPLSAKQRLIWEKMRASKPDVSIFVTGNEVRYEIHLDDDLMNDAKAFAKRKKLTLAKVIEQGVRGVLAFGG